MVDKIQFVFCDHTYGHLAFEEKVQKQPPLGILTVASFLKHKLPNINVEVFYGKNFSDKELLERLDAKIIGFSVWFSNYEKTMILAEKLKSIKPKTTIILGGPYSSTIAERILSNNKFVDYVISGDGEIPLWEFVKGTPKERIPGLYYRLNYNNKTIILNRENNYVDLNDIPLINLELLNPPFQWTGNRNSPAMSAFPLSGIRGCTRSKKRCEYCAIPINSYRYSSAQKYWNQINHLHSNYGIDYFFETGDTIIRGFFKNIADYRHKVDVAFRIYSYPGYLRDEDIPYLKRMGVNTVFIGIESVLHFSDNFNRNFRKNYRTDSLIKEISNLGKHNINVVAGFLLGLPGEDKDSLNSNIKLIRKVSGLSNVNEITVSIVLPLPGSKYFDICCNDPVISSAYESKTGHNLINTDIIEHYYLSKLFVNRFTNIDYCELNESISSLNNEFGAVFANWGRYYTVT